MQFLKKLSLVVVIMLLLAILKISVDRSGIVYRDFLRNLIANLQLLLLSGVVFIGLLQAVFVKFFHRELRFWKAALAFLLLLSLAEGGSYFLLRHPAQIPQAALSAFKEYYGSYGRQQIEFDPSCARYDTGLTYTLLPDTAFEFNNYEFKTDYTTNHLGLRDDNSSLYKPSVICLGDSYTMGWGVSQSETFSALLERKTGLKVLNAGISSYGTAREMLSLERMDLSALQYIIIQYCGNDAKENNTFLDHHYRLPVMSRYKYDSLCKALQSRLTYYPFRHILTIIRLWARQGFGKSSKDINPILSGISATSFQSQVASFAAILNNRISRLPPVNVIVFDMTGTFPAEHRFIEALHRLKQKDGSIAGGNISLTDISPFMKKEDFFLLDDHLNAHGHARVANILSNTIVPRN